jgi:23S rRNA (guanine745-N1)-methyltransferase
MLLCPVRDCHQPLTPDDRRFVCPRNHSFDVARSGYINLLQPQDRRSRHPGDTAAAIAGRRRLHESGVTAPLLDAISEFAAPIAADTILDAGCGEGSVLGILQRRTSCDAHGVDISIPAIDAAARRYPECHWIVANADRFVPFGDRSFSLILSITARVNVPEFHRILKPGGRLLIALPAPDDLVELRGSGRDDRVARTIEAAGPAFALIGQRRATTTADLDAVTVQDVLHTIYRPKHAGPVGAMRLTFSLDLLLFAGSKSAA